MSVGYLIYMVRYFYEFIVFFNVFMCDFFIFCKFVFNNFKYYVIRWKMENYYDQVLNVWGGFKFVV